MIKAKGIKNGKRIELEANKKRGEWYFTFNGQFDAVLEEELLEKMSEAHPFAGMRYPENEEQRLASVVEGFFFDVSPDSVYVSFDLEKTPDEEGVY